MSDESAQDLREAASRAHRRGDVETAVSLYRKILDLYPGAREAIDAAFYLTSIGKGRRRDAKPATTATPEPKEARRGGAREKL